MKKILTAFLLLAVFALPMTAYAQDATGGNITVSYEYTAQSGGGSDTTYIINIPAYVTVEDMEVIPITASKNNIPAGKRIAVTVDYDYSYDTNGQFRLYKNKGEANQESIFCRVYTYSDSTLTTLYNLDNIRNRRIAEFEAGNLNPTFGGYLCFSPMTAYATVSSGTYTGVLYFNIHVEDIEVLE